MTPDAIAPIPILSAGLLVAAGAAKLHAPGPTAQVLLDVGAPVPTTLARIVGVVELVVGLWALAFGGPAAWLGVGACYLAFACFLGFVMRRVPAAGSCGCAGAKAVPPSRLHLVLNLVAGGSCLVAAVAGVPGAVAWTLGLDAVAIPVMAGLALAAWLSVIAVTEVPGAWRAWTPPPVHDDHVHEPRDLHARAEESLAAAGIGPDHPSLWPGTEPPGRPEGAV
ncbi:MAG: MauE/DoxX family redox-associated membrane protein [Actinomycetota bacterium]